MSIELPGPVVDFLSVIGINWPNVDEDKVREFAGHVRDFASNLDSTHQAATSTIQQMQEHYQGGSYEQLVAAWSQMSSSHMQDLQEGSKIVAEALDIAADAIVGLKTAAIAELVVMAATFVADQAAAVLTFGIAEAAEAAIIAAGRKVVDFLEQEIIGQIMGQVIGAAVVPLEGLVEKAVNGLTFAAAGALTGGDGVSEKFMIDPAGLQQHISALQQHSDTIAQHADTFSANVSNLNFAG
ncbi:MAG TPA: hypothetical protein VL551_07180 [Actinospica sp.]|jgi:uncharacterized protein YukE|nr:hypothetical protein [Actinospica sp.]